MDAKRFLIQAINDMNSRATDRDTTAERSMERTVMAFWTIFGTGILKRGFMTETDGWEFMSILKKVRGSQGSYRQDDYQDDVAYAALAAESAFNAQIKDYKEYEDEIRGSNNIALCVVNEVCSNSPVPCGGLPSFSHPSADPLEGECEGC